MLSNISFTEEWIKEQLKALGGSVQPIILEKSILALALVSHLAESGLDFTFKGGTSLLLHLGKIHRLSIDIDIITPMRGGGLVDCLDSIAHREPFIGYEEDERGVGGLPNRRHFKFHYDPVNADDAENHQSHIILDVVEEDRWQLPTENKKIWTPFIKLETDTEVIIPTVTSLLADKLTAFAPTTIGVPYVKNNGETNITQVAKQMFDVGALFNEARDISGLLSAYAESYELENEYRGSASTSDECLDDTINAARKLCQHDLRGAPADEEANQLARGVLNLSNHLVNAPFRLNLEAKATAAKAAFLATAIKVGVDNLDLANYRYGDDKIDEIGSATLVGESASLQILRRINPEAFYYWHKAQEFGA